MPMLSKQAKKNKVAYNMERNKELYGKFQTLLPKEEFKSLNEYLQSIGMNKAEFVRWAYEELKKQKH